MSDPTDIPNWLRIDDRITSSGRLTQPQIVNLQSIGVKYVINLAPDTHERALAGERETVARNGMDYIYIPVAFDAPTEEDFSHFYAAMKEIGDRPVHVHCIVNARVSAFLYRYRRDILGVNDADAREPMERVWQPGGE